MVKSKSIKFVVISVAIIIILALLNTFLVNIIYSPSDVINYFIFPIFLYIPAIIIDIAILLCIITWLTKKQKITKIIAVTLVCILVTYLVVCFRISAHSKIKNYNEFYSLKSISQQIGNSIFGEYSDGIEAEYTENSYDAFGNAVLFECDETYTVKSCENPGSYLVEIYCYDNYPILSSQKFISKLENKYFHSEYAYSLSKSEFGEEDIVYGVKDGVSYQYCCVNSTTNGELKNRTYFAMLLNDGNSTFLACILIYQKDYMKINAEKELENILELTEQLWLR